MKVIKKYDPIIVAISVDEQNHEYSLRTRDGNSYTGYPALNSIRFNKIKGENDKEQLQAYYEDPEIRRVRYEKKLNNGGV